MQERTSLKREPKPCSLTSEWRRCVYEPGRCRKCIGAKIRAHIEKARTGRPLAEFPCPYFERAATLGQWPAPAGSGAESLERTAEKFAAMLAAATPTSEEVIENVKRATAQLCGQDWQE